MKGLRWLLLRNWENLSGKQKSAIRELEKANRRMFRAWQLKKSSTTSSPRAWPPPAELYADTPDRLLRAQAVSN